MDWFTWFIVAVGLGLLICGVLAVAFLFFLFIRHYDWRLWPSIRRARRRVRDLVLQRSSFAKIVTRPGATPEKLTMFIGTRTDADAERLRKDDSFIPAARNALLLSGYPPNAVTFVHFPILSKETVDRDYAGRWTEAMEYP
jgi:hypothetical protein